MRYIGAKDGWMNVGTGRWRDYNDYNAILHIAQRGVDT